MRLIPQSLHITCLEIALVGPHQGERHVFQPHRVKHRKQKALRWIICHRKIVEFSGICCLSTARLPPPSSLKTSPPAKALFLGVEQ